jgi:hypothetical protein
MLLKYENDANAPREFSGGNHVVRKILVPDGLQSQFFRGFPGRKNCLDNLWGY